MSAPARIPVACRLAAFIARKPLQPLWTGLFLLALRGLGYNNWVSALNGEDRFLRRWLAARAGTGLTVFDVGAHDGSFTDVVLSAHPTASIHLFEPNPPTFARLRRKYGGEARAHLENIGVGADSTRLSLFDVAGAGGTERASFFAETFGVLEKMPAHAVDVPVVSLDEYCEAHSLARIDYLKIDTEGFEKAVLVGCRGLLRNRAVGVIQLEMNEHNLISGFSLYELTHLLPDFDIYRLLPNGLVDVVSRRRPYRSSFDMPRYCNLVAINASERASCGPER